jgi:hypothetical protein
VSPVINFSRVSDEDDIDLVCQEVKSCPDGFLVKTLWLRQLELQFDAMTYDLFVNLFNFEVFPLSSATGTPIVAYKSFIKLRKYICNVHNDRSDQFSNARCH